MISKPEGTVEGCPHCRSDRLAIQVITWANYQGGQPLCFDPEDIDYVEPVLGGNAVCRCCYGSFVLPAE
jgi:hypothetical protein